MEGQDPTRKLLEQKIALLEGQITTLYEYVGNPQGELFASQLQVNRLEQSVYKHQTTLEQVKLQLDTFTKGLSKYIDDLFAEISKQRGARGADVQTLVKFTSTQLTEAIAKLQSNLDQTIQQLIPFRKLQDLERHLLTRQQKQFTSPYGQYDDSKLVQMETRLGLLETKAAKTNEIVQIQEPESEQSTTLPLEQLQQQLEHLQKQVVQQAEKAYGALARHGELGAPLSALQSQVTVMDAELKAFKAECNRRLIDGQITASAVNVKQSLEKQLAEKAGTEDVAKLSTAVNRAETFSRDVQTGFTRFKKEFEDITRQIQDTLTKENLEDFRALRSETEALGKEVKEELSSVRLLSKEFAKINRSLEALREENQTLVNQWLDTQMEKVQDSLKIYNDQKMNIIRYQLANEVEKIVKEDFEKFFNTKSIKLIESHVETQLPEKIKKQVDDRMTELELATKTDFYQAQKETSRVLDLNRSTEKSLAVLKEKTAEQVAGFVEQFDHLRKMLLANQTETGKLQKQVQHLTLQVKDLQGGITQEQKRFEHRITEMVQQMKQQLYLDLVDQDRKPVFRPPPVKTSPQTVPTNNKRQDVLYNSLTKCFYTALFGTSKENVDQLANFDRIPGWDYICFTNFEMPEHRGWKIIHVDFQGNDAAMAAKWHKWNSHRVLGDYDVVVWMDAYLSPNPMYTELLKHWILQMIEQNALICHRPHAERRCIWEECDAVVQTRRAKAEDVQKVRDALVAAQMPKDYGLYDTNVMIKLHKNMLTQHICEEVYRFMEQHCNRDQLATTLVYYLNNFQQVQTQTLLRAVNATGTHARNPV